MGPILFYNNIRRGLLSNPQKYMEDFFMKDKHVRLLCFSAMFAALILVCTMFIKLPVPATTEYIHIGDGVLYLAAALLPLPYAIAASAIGAALADVLASYAVWAPFTFVIKTIMALCIGKMCRPDSGRGRLALAALAAGAVNVALYFVSSAILYGLGGAAAGVPFNLLQSAVAAVLFVVLLPPVRKALSGLLPRGDDK